MARSTKARRQTVVPPEESSQSQLPNPWTAVALFTLGVAALPATALGGVFVVVSVILGLSWWWGESEPTHRISRPADPAFLRSRSIRGYFNHPYVGRMAKHAAQHADQIFLRLDTFLHLIEEKLSPQELTFQRFVGSVDRLNVRLEQNQDRILFLLTQLAAFSKEEKERAEMDRDRLPAGKKSTHEFGEAKIFSPKQQYMDSVQALFLENEKAIATLDRLNASLFQLRSAGEIDKREVDPLLKDLETFAGTSPKS